MVSVMGELSLLESLTAFHESQKSRSFFHRANAFWVILLLYRTYVHYSNLLVWVLVTNAMYCRKSWALGVFDHEDIT